MSLWYVFVSCSGNDIVEMIDVWLRFVMGLLLRSVKAASLSVVNACQFACL